MWVIREVDARRRVSCAPARVDAEGTDFPVGGNRPDDEEDKDQGANEQKEAEAPPPATIRLVIPERRGGGLNSWGNGGGIL